MKKGAESREIPLPVKLPRESDGPLRRTVGPITIVDTRYLEWLERGAEQNINNHPSSQGKTSLIVDLSPSSE
jgi:hypothetical protein